MLRPPEDRQETIADKQAVESMVTAILTNDVFGGYTVGHGMTAQEERYVRAGASICPRHGATKGGLCRKCQR